MKKNNFIFLLILLGLLLRLLFAFFPGFKIDVDAWFAWAIRLNQVGFSNFYSDQIWTNYTPGYLYILKLFGILKIILPVSDNLFYLLLKLPSIIAEIILGAFIYQLISKKSLIWARLCAALVLLNPVLIFNSSVWGQIDGLLSLLMLLSIYFLTQNKLIYSSLFLGLSFLVKPQTIGLIPIFVLYILLNLSVKNILKITLPTVFSIFILSLPFYTNHLLGLPQLFSKMVGDYSYTSLYAYNFWGIVGFWINDKIYWNNLPYHFWGYILYFGYWFLIAYFYKKQKLSIFSLSALAMLAFFFLPTRVHERYLYPGIIFLITICGLCKSKLLLFLTSFLSLIHLLNLYYVYVYYNEFYLKLPKVLYNPILYNFLDSNGKILSVISTIIFLIITFVIIRNSYVTEKVNA